MSVEAIMLILVHPPEGSDVCLCDLDYNVIRGYMQEEGAQPGGRTVVTFCRTGSNITILY